MKAIIKFELRRAFINRAYLLALCIGIGICIWHLVSSVIPFSNDYSAHFAFALASRSYPNSLYNTWIGTGLLPGIPAQINLYLFILPLLIAIPFVGSYHSDRTSGYAINVITRTKASHYYCAKLLAIFLTAASIAIIPLLFDLFATALFIPALTPEVTTGTYPVGNRTMWAEIYYQAPLLYFGMHFVIIAVISGLMALLGAVTSYYAHTVFCLLTPFAVGTFASFLLGALGISQYAPLEFLRMSASITDGLALLTTLTVLIVGLGLFFFFKIRKDELC